MAAFLLFAIYCYSASATHIVGGVLNYRYLGSNNYEFTLFVYRDCKNGLAPFDRPALIQVAYGDNTEFDEFNADVTQEPDTLDHTVNDPCVTVQPDVCVEFVKYVFLLNLPADPRGYIVSYSRCCRNNSILNLTRGSSGDGLNEIDWGATYTINIPGAAAAPIQNSSPVFKNFPPVGICANKAIVFDHSATDADGDSLVYRLCAPFDGATKLNPANTTPFVIQLPPYDNVLFQSPFSLSDLLGGVPLTIDPHTGLLTGTPTIIGQFVVGICVDEYRNGQFLTRTLRDFQFNVTDCGLRVVSSFFAPSVLCNNFTVGFTNQSSGATTYKWYFGDGDSSSVVNPTHTYADTGHYNVTLISNPGEVCFNTSTQIVSVQFKKVDAGFTVSDSACLSSGDTIKFMDQSTDSFNINHWQWTFSTGKSDTSQNSFIIYNGTIPSVTATLTVNSVNGCVSSISKTILLSKKTTYTLPPSITACKGSKIQLPLSISGNHIYNWSPSTGLDNTTLQNPTATLNGNIKYYVTIKTANGNDTCVQRDSISLLASDSIDVHIIPKNPTLTCSGRTISLTAATTPPGVKVYWSSSPAFSTIIDSTNSIQATIAGSAQTFYVKAAVASGCVHIDSSTVTIGDSIPPIVLADTLIVCHDSIRLSSVVPASSSVTWSTSPTFIPVIGTDPSITIAQSQPLVKYYIKAQTNTCFNTDSIVVIYNDTLPTIRLADSSFFCGSDVSASATVINADSIIWSINPNFIPVLSNQPTLNTTQANILQTYYIKAFFRSCSSTDSTIIRAQNVLPQIAITDSVYVCADSIRLVGRITNFDSVKWSFDPLFTTVFSTNPSIVIEQTVPERVYYVKVFYLQCEITDSFRVFKNDTIPVVFIDRSKTIFCSNTVGASGTADYHTSFTWASDLNFTNVISTDSFFVTTQTEAEKWYYFKAMHNFCFDVDSIKLENRSIKYSRQDAEVCAGNKLTAAINVQTPSQYDVFWYVNGDTLETTNVSSLEFTPDTTQMLRFRIDNIYGCSENDSLHITVDPVPPVDAGVDKQIIYRGEQVQLTSTQGVGYSYNWTPAGSVSSPSIYNPTSSPTQTTLYTVTISDRTQCTNFDTVSVKVVDYSCSLGLIYLPNAFTPNGDGINDIFKVRSNILRSMNLAIYDRWGNKVFETENINDGWDGFYKGQPAPVESYGYYFMGECLQGEKINLKGNVSLMR
jgi:gliding motility-associated-like protein